MQVLRCSPKKEILNLSMSLGRGGEACVYAVPSDNNLVAKIYHKPSSAHAEKLQAMLANPPENPTASLGHISIAWPEDLLHAADGSNGILGFLMPRIQGMRPIIDFYNPRTRRQHCPLFNYQYLLRTARNLAAAFAALHASGYCIGDVNESNILVSDTALVTLIDTDSFQVRNPDTDIVYRCSVGKPEFTPPELQNKTFAEHDREISHDLFGLAVLVFQLLMEGTHPFSGIFQGAIEPPTYEARIAAGHFTYSQKRRVPYLPTPIAPPWEILHPSLQELFLRCFEDGHNNPQLRPSAQTWLSAIAEAEDSLITCTTNPQHRYNNHLNLCPWCERSVRLGGRDPFPSHRAIEAREHLQPRIKPKKRHTQTPRLPQRAMSPHLANYWQPMTPTGSHYKRSKKSNLYPIGFCLLGLVLLGSADLMIKFTEPLVSHNAYTQQTLKSGQGINKLSFADYYQQGHTAYKQRDYEKAVANYSQAIEQEPKHARALVNRGNARYNLKDYEGAVSDYTQALKIKPSEIKALVNRGNARFMLAEYSNDPDTEYNLALTDYNRAIGLEPNEVEAYIRRGIVRAQMAKYSGESQQVYKRAIADFTQAIKLNLSKAEAYFQRGVVYYQIAQYSSNYEEEYRQAIADFNQALTISPKLAKAFLKRGMVRYELAQYGGSESNQNQTRAIADLQTAAKIFLEQDDMDNYQQALSNMCVVVENKCDPLFQGSSSGEKIN
ncbi:MULTISPECIES: tetratricopeptide repeat protein [Nostoc]|uniref:Tetratricopeptide repeat protein n=1 Tax=Nostoc paludosum FACHB-159 TaxID=2692908 RepID=A0ABR8K0E7_9NOSO|nr:MULTISPECIES: tetratricopeptide repeat protein [Nostoc]MBD2676247.1 tetratricopeptide repeat protein [Nostoc sp. FACHB-857]MBD2732625.1 tetratricopeptide repeat protein [Nostoc paludosum FACHB-159]